MRMYSSIVALVVASFVSIVAPAHAQFAGLKKLGATAKDKITGADGAKSDQDKKDGPVEFTVDLTPAKACEQVKTALQRDGVTFDKVDCVMGQITTEWGNRHRGSGFKKAREYETRIVAQIMAEGSKTMVRVTVSEHARGNSMTTTEWSTAEIKSDDTIKLAAKLQEALSSNVATTARQ